MAARDVRARSLQRLAALGIDEPPSHLPVLWQGDDACVLRSRSEVVARMAVLNVVVGRSYGMPASAASEWVDRNGMKHALTNREALVVSGGDSDESDRLQVEAIQAFAWLLGLVAILSPQEFCSDSLVTLLPDLRRGESLPNWETRVGAPQMASTDDAAQEWDFHYCATWVIANANLMGTPPPATLPAYVFWQRRRALEFAFAGTEMTHADWEDADMST